MSARDVTFYADRAQLQAWFAAARPGERAIYATGPSLDERHETVRAVGRWRQDGLVTCKQDRAPGGAWRYQIRIAEDRRHDAAGGISPVDQPKGALPAEWQHRPEGALYRLLCARAEAGAACPSHSEIAELLDLPDRHAARARLRKLIEVGAVRVVEQPLRAVPTIEIVATGARTVPAKGASA